MDKKVGLWIDHRKAVVVSITGKEADLSTIASDVERHVRLSGGSRSSTPFGPQEIASDQQKDERWKHQLRKFYQEVLRSIEDAREIYIFGPGEAKGELKKEAGRRKDLAPRVKAVENSDKLTDPQIVAKVKKYFKVGG